MPTENERKYREMVVRFRQIQQRFEMAKTIEDRKAVLEEMRKLSEECLAFLNRGGLVAEA